MRAAIAIGSNSTRMLAAEKKNGTLANLLRGREETRLFLGMDDAGRILPERIETITAQLDMESLARFRTKFPVLHDADNYHLL